MVENGQMVGWAIHGAFHYAAADLTSMSRLGMTFNQKAADLREVIALEYDQSGPVQMHRKLVPTPLPRAEISAWPRIPFTAPLKTRLHGVRSSFCNVHKDAKEDAKEDGN